MKSKILVPFLAILLFFAACTTEKSNTELLTGNTWRITAWTVSPPILGITDWYADSEACETDNLYTFETGGIAKLDEGPTKCNASDAQTTTGTWSFNADETELTVTAEGVTQVWQVQDLTDSTLRVKYINVDGSSGVSYTFIITFTSI